MITKAKMKFELAVLLMRIASRVNDAWVDMLSGVDGVSPQYKNSKRAIEIEEGQKYVFLYEGINAISKLCGTPIEHGGKWENDMQIRTTVNGITFYAFEEEHDEKTV